MSNGQRGGQQQQAQAVYNEGQKIQKEMEKSDSNSEPHFRIDVNQRTLSAITMLTGYTTFILNYLNKQAAFSSAWRLPFSFNFARCYMNLITTILYLRSNSISDHEVS